MRSYLEANQPVSVTGVFTHVIAWLKSSSGDRVYRNPNFKVQESDPEYLKEGIAFYGIHGLADRNSACERAAERLLLGELPGLIHSIYLPSFENRVRGKGIKNYAKQLRDKIKMNGDKNVILMGHSRGGLVAAYLSEYLAKDADINVHAVITIGTPFSGSPLAVEPLSWWSKSVKQMKKDSPFLKRLCEKISESDTYYYYFAAQNDVLVPIQSTFVEKKNNSFVLLDRHGHLSIMSSHRLVEHIRCCIVETCHRLLGNDAEDDDEHAILEAFTLMQDDNEHQEKSVLAEVCDDIDDCVLGLKERVHLKSILFKVNVLQQLKVMLTEIMQERCNNYYPQAESVGDFIHLYMQDENMGMGKKPMMILSEPLNHASFSLFTEKKSLTQLAVEELIVKYQHTPLPLSLVEIKEDVEIERNESRMR
jgi:pimeloyl-ACP methyl ester carboxylesterase